MLRRSRPSRSVDYLLAILSPVDVVEATQRYVASQSADALRAHAHRAIARMRSAERRELAIAFGQAVARTDNPLFDDAAPDEPELLALVDGSTSLHQQFTTFLKHNPRALRTLDSEAVNDILRPLVVHARAAMEPGTRDPDNGDDLRKVLLSALPSMRVVRARRWSRSARAFAHKTSRRVSAAPGLALAALVTALRWIVHPFIVAGRATAAGVAALGRFIASIPRLLLSALLWIAQPFVAAGRALATGAMAVARAIARIPQLVLALLSLLVLPFVLAARTATERGQSIARASARGWSIARAATLSFAAALARAVRDLVRELARAIAQVPGHVKSGVRRIAKPCRVAIRAFEAFVARIAFGAATGLIFLYALLRSGWISLRRAGRTIAAHSAQALRRVPPLAEAGAQRASAVAAITASVIMSALAMIPPAARKGLQWLTPRVSALAVLAGAVLFMLATMTVVAIFVLARVLFHVARAGGRSVQRIAQQIPPLVGDAATWTRPRVARATSASVDVARAGGRYVQKRAQQIPPLVDDAVTWTRPRVARATSASVDAGTRAAHRGVERLQTEWPRVRNALRVARKLTGRIVFSAFVMAVALAFVAVQQLARLTLWIGRRTMAARPWQHAQLVPILGIGGALTVLVLLMIVPQRIANEHAVRGIAKATIHPHRIHIAQFHRAAPNMRTVVFIASPLPAVTDHPRRIAPATPAPRPMRVLTIAALLNPKKFPVHHQVRIPHVGAAPPTAHHPQTVAQGAEQQVLSYLMSLSRGDDRAALRTLGMSPSASRDVIPEAALVHSATDFRILNSHTTDAYDATVSVDIRAPQGDYLALYTLSNDGSGMRIVYHSVIPNSAKAPALLSTR